MKPTKRSDALMMRLFLSILFIVIIIFARHAFLTNTFIWLWDISITFALALIIYFVRNRLRLTPLLYAFFLFALVLHDFGVYGFYTKNFFGLNYDQYTHFFGSFAIAMILFNWIMKSKASKIIQIGKASKIAQIDKDGKAYNEKKYPEKTAHLEYKQRTVYKPLSLSSICFITILIVLGVSAIHEAIEFLGYTYLNADGPNLFFPGNAAVKNVAETDITITNLTNIMPTLTSADIGTSGSYQNTMIDILYNMVGAVAGCVVMSAKRIIR